MYLCCLFIYIFQLGWNHQLNFVYLPRSQTLCNYTLYICIEQTQLLIDRVWTCLNYGMGATPYDQIQPAKVEDLLILGIDTVDGRIPVTTWVV